jgi:hypothetical protein
MRWTGHAAHIGGKKCACRDLAGIPGGRHHENDINTNEKIILK